VKLLFVVFKRADVGHNQCLAQWHGEKHTALVRQLPGLVRWVQNHVASVPHENAPDGIGELWFSSADALTQAMSSPEMAAAVEDAKSFLDMERTYALVVDEKVVVESSSIEAK
jgi:uncharacterized protein (TIGR02118 family)